MYAWITLHSYHCTFYDSYTSASSEGMLQSSIITDVMHITARVVRSVTIVWFPVKEIITDVMHNIITARAEGFLDL